MKDLLIIIAILSGILLSFAILLQHRASGLSATFGGTGTTYVQRRGAEKVLFQITVWLSVIFFGVSSALLLVPSY